MELKQKNENIQKVQQTLHTYVQKVYQKVVRERPNVLMQDKVKNVDDTILELQEQMQELQLKIKLAPCQRKGRGDKKQMKIRTHYDS